MRARFLAIAAAVWTVANAGIYLLVISAQGNSPAWWYPAVLGTSALLFALAAGRLWPVPLLITGAILLTGHFGNFELGGAMLGQLHAVDVVVRPLSNPGVEALLARERERAGLTAIPADRGIRRVYASLRAGRWVAMVGDQDARHHGAFVPFLGRPASTALGPARIALATGAPILMGFVTREPAASMRIKAWSLARTMVEIAMSPSFSARITSVPPPR